MSPLITALLTPKPAHWVPRDELATKLLWEPGAVTICAVDAGIILFKNKNNMIAPAGFSGVVEYSVTRVGV